MAQVWRSPLASAIWRFTGNNTEGLIEAVKVSARWLPGVPARGTKLARRQALAGYYISLLTTRLGMGQLPSQLQSDRDNSCTVEGHY